MGSAINSLWGVPWTASDTEFWAGGSFYKYHPDKSKFVTQWFELHCDPERHGSEWMKWAIENQPACYLQEAHPELKNSSRYPIEEMIDHFGKYFTSTASYMIASAIIAEATEISIFGIDLRMDTEYVYERPNLEYFVGVARGMGIEVLVGDRCTILKSDFLYGYDEAPIDGWPVPDNLVKLVDVAGHSVSSAIGRK